MYYWLPQIHCDQERKPHFPMGVFWGLNEIMPGKVPNRVAGIWYPANNAIVYIDRYCDKKWMSLSRVRFFATPCSPGNSPGQNTGMGSLSLFQGIFPTRDQTQVSCIVGGFFTSWAIREAQEYWSGYLSLLQWIFLTQESNRGLLLCKRILYQLTYQGSPFKKK